MIKHMTALSHAQEIAVGLLIPHAESVDATGHIPEDHLKAMAERGLFGLWAPAAVGGWDVTHQEARRVYEVLAGGCGSTYFAWWQHHAIVRKLAASVNPELAERWLPLLARGQARAGDMNYLRRPGRPMIRASRVPGGYQVDGTAPWVACCGLAHVFIVAAVLDEETAIYLLVPAEKAGITATPIVDLLAMSGSRCASVSLEGVFVPATHLIIEMDISGWRARDPRRNAQPMPAAFGVAGRAIELLRAQCRTHSNAGLQAAVDLMAAELNRCRRSAYDLEDRFLGGVDVPLHEQIALRAQSHDLSVRISAALIAATGGRATERSNPAQRLFREAAFHSIQAQTELVKVGTVECLARISSRGAGENPSS